MVCSPFKIYSTKFINFFYSSISSFLDQRIEMSLHKKAVFLCGLLLLLWNTNAQLCTSGTTSWATNGDPHYFTVCSNGLQILTKCPSSTLYAHGTTNLKDCSPYYGGCSLTVGGCVPCEYFPWPASNPASVTAPACSSVGAVAPYCDPSYYWYCSCATGTAELKACPSGYGYSTIRTIGCTPWYNWNTQS